MNIQEWRNRHSDENASTCMDCLYALAIFGVCLLMAYLTGGV